MEINWINQKGREILLLDYTGIKMEKDMIAHTNRAIPLLTQKEKGTKVLILIDLTGCFVTPGYLESSKKLEREVLDNYEIKRALVGITGPKAVLLKGFNLFAKQKLVPFETRELALDYLSKQ